jgi:ribosomal-protein-alanine N-acetyltransferase
MEALNHHRANAKLAFLAHNSYATRASSSALITEALMAAIKYVFEELNLHRVMANYMPGNEKSAKLLQRLGFKVEGHARDYLRLAGDWQDHTLTALVNESWRPR